MQIAGRSPASHPSNPLVDKQSESAAIRLPLPWLLILLLLLIYQRLQEQDRSEGTPQRSGGAGCRSKRFLVTFFQEKK
ncbi:hypothetical protein J2W83_003022 [Pseudomonas hunanensis]|uniref:Uncharacterized protein n=1 Tax=Pseudomonas hunanensis TaxID=1247546 RepID=A0ACC6K4K5_9PSED|nr:hypothetical protein [Pseudomonas hunanensis]